MTLAGGEGANSRRQLTCPLALRLLDITTPPAGIAAAVSDCDMAHDPRQHTPDWRRLSAAINRNALRKQRLLRDVFVSRNRFVVASAYDDDDAVFARGTELPRPVPAKSLEKLPGPAAATSSEELRVPAPGQSSEELLVDFLVESMLDDMIRDLG